jgi:acyl-CoA thioesterase FadM
VTEPVWQFPLVLPRHAFSPRDAARAADVWRACQDVAVEASDRAGWPPQRFREARTAFIVRKMTVRHDRETTYGERLQARTWVGHFRRDMLSTRQIRIDGSGGPVAAATQEWVHVTDRLEPARAGRALLDAFPAHEEDGSVTMPAFDPETGSSHELAFVAWHVWMDPLNHVNHPAYLDWCEEATARSMAAKGLDPIALVPVADKVTYKAGATAGDRIRVITHVSGRTADGDVVLSHRIVKNDDEMCADAVTVRRLVNEDGSRLLDALR